MCWRIVQLGLPRNVGSVTWRGTYGLSRFGDHHSTGPTASAARPSAHTEQGSDSLEPSLSRPDAGIVAALSLWGPPGATWTVDASKVMTGGSSGLCSSDAGAACGPADPHETGLRDPAQRGRIR
jgi:hypothetical protein